MFRLCAGYIAGILLVVTGPVLPSPFMALPLGLAAALLRSPLLLGLGLGLVLASLSAERELARWLPTNDSPVQVQAEARVAGIPELRERGLRLELELLSSSPVLPARRVQVFWPNPAVMPRAGETWALELRLSRPGGFRNRTGFDRERWALAQRIHARGQVANADSARQLTAESGVHALRQRLAEGLQRAIPGVDARALAVALVVGDRQHLERDLWQRLIATGTNHLVAISGLHVGLLAGAVWLLASLAWRAVPGLCSRYPARLAGAWPALVAAFCYALLAGFALPTQRALLMFAVLALLLLGRRTVSPGQTLLIAVAVILVLDPLAPVSAAFWLSSIAVAVLVLAGLGGMAQRPVAGWIHAQFALLAGLLPLTVYWFGQVAWVAPVANLVAVPLVGALAVPVLLSGALVYLIVPGWGEFLWQWAGWMLQGLVWFVETLTRLADLYRVQGEVSAVLAVSAALAAVLLLAPRGFPGRWLAPLLILPLLMPLPAAVPDGQAEIRLHHVGHGQALQVRTRRHHLVLDSGPVIPGLGLLPRRDGALFAFSRDRAGYRGAFDAAGIRPEALCELPSTWTWDGVRFRVHRTSAGCLLQIDAGEARLLVLGGLERPLAESEWAGLALPKARFLIAGGHGHSAYHPQLLLDRVRPEHVLVSVSAANRWNLPHVEFREALTDRGATLWITACQGELTWRLGRDQGIRMHARNRHWWRAGKPAGCP